MIEETAGYQPESTLYSAGDPCKHVLETYIPICPAKPGEYLDTNDLCKKCCEDHINEFNIKTRSEDRARLTERSSPRAPPLKTDQA